VRRDELRKRIAALRGEAGRLARMLPPAGPEQSAEDASARYWLERAAWCCQQGEKAWEPGANSREQERLEDSLRRLELERVERETRDA
jgi:hypothetical protein